MADDTAAGTGAARPREDVVEPLRDPSFLGAIIRLMDPIPLTVLLILVSVLMLIGASVLGQDSGQVLAKMADHEFARGLITYLFAVTTIGTSVVLVLAALTGKASQDTYQRGKEILALMLGVFGTIVGFYFGSEAHSEAPAQSQLVLAQPLLSETAVASGASVRLTAHADGGAPPYSYAISLDPSGDLDYQTPVEESGWIVTDVAMPAVEAVTEVRLRLGIRDSAGQTVIKEAMITVRPPTRGP